MQKFLKFIIPCYNCEKTINRMVDSILNQTCKDFFIVLVDDMSTDNTFKILKEHEQKYPDYIKAVQVPKKAYADGAREFGFKQYNDAEFTWFVDADDQLANENVVQILKDVHQQKQLDLYTFDSMQFEFDLTLEKHGWFTAAPWFRIVRSDMIIFDVLNIMYYDDVLQSLLQYDAIDDEKIYHIDRALYNYKINYRPYIPSCEQKIFKKIKEIQFKKDIIKNIIKKQFKI